MKNQGFSDFLPIWKNGRKNLLPKSENYVSYKVNGVSYKGEVSDTDFERPLFYDTKIKVYPDGSQKAVYSLNRLFRVPVKGLVNNHRFFISDVKIKRVRRDNVSRCFSRIRDLILCNDFKYFVTITFDDEKVLASSPFEVLNKLTQWLKNMVYRKGLKYIFVPEYHKKKGRVHLHGLINDSLEFVDSFTRIVEGFDRPLKVTTIEKYGVTDKVKKIVYNIVDWKYGFSTAIPLDDNLFRVSNYVLKYITKDTEKIFGNRFLHSQNLVKSPVIDLYNTRRFNLVNSKEYSVSGERFRYEDNFSDLHT